MPSHTIPSAVIKLWTLGIPWDYPVWQAATGVHHGLFPDDPQHLPKNWTPDDAQNIKSYFDQYRLKPTEDDKIAFSKQRKGSALPGRKKWRNWITSIWRTARVHERITAVLSANNCHPLNLAVGSIDSIESVESVEPSVDSTGWPMGSTWIPTCLDEIACELFGEECLDKSGRLPERFRAPTQALVQRTWNNLTKRLDRCKKRLPVLEKEAVEAFNGLQGETVSKDNIRDRIQVVIRAVAKWRNFAEVLDEQDNDQITAIQEVLDCLMERLGVKLDKKKKKKERTPAPRLFKLSQEMLKSLSTEEDVQDIIALYREHFDNPAISPDDIPLIDRDPIVKISFGSPVEGADPGTEIEANMSSKKLALSLGFVRGTRIPLLFNDIRHLDGLNYWTNAEAFAMEDRDHLPKSIVKLRLHWHQLAGVHAIIRACFTAEPDRDHCTGVLVADEVGLGKTYQAATVIAFLAEAAIRQDDLIVAPILQACPYLAGETEIPRLPHLILAPGTLTIQWVDELHILYTPGSIDIFIYPTSAEERELFWAADAPFHLSRHEMSNRIIVAPHSALQKDYNALHLKKPKKSGSLPWDPLPLRSAKHRPEISKTLFGQRYLSITLDEAHNFRNHGAKHSAALEILKLAIIRLILSATPLQTATKDLAAMARLTGIPHFTTEYAWAEEKEDGCALRRARKDAPADYDPLDDNDEDPVRICQVSIAQRIQRQTRGHLLRRTVDSKDWRGNPLIPLPPCKIVHVTLDLTPRELDIITKNGQALKESVGTANLAMKLITRGFYIEYRLSVIFAREHPDEPLPVFKSLDEWEKMKSTKLDVAARLCQYFLTRDDLPLPQFKDGTVQFPKIHPLREGEAASRDTKIVVFSEFPSMLSVLLNVFTLYGVKILAVNGSMAYDKRASIIKQFREDPSYRVLALSSVGTTGINLAFCRIIIFLDQPWSAQDERQMRGRVHRQPQQHEVLSIHLLAKDTADIIVSGMARGKQDMMEAYLAKRAGQDMFNLLTGGGAVNPRDDKSDDEQITTQAQSKGKGVDVAATSIRKPKVKPVVVQDNDQEEEEEVAISIIDPVAPQPKKSKSKSKSSAHQKPQYKSKATIGDETDASPAKNQITSKSVVDETKEPDMDEEPAQSKGKSKFKAAPMAMDVDSSSSKPSTKSTKTSAVTASFVSSAAMAAKAKSKRLEEEEEEEEEEEDSDEEPMQPKSKSKSKAASMAMDVDSTSASSKPSTKPTKTPTVTASFVSSAAMAAKAKSKRLEEEEEEEEEDSDEEPMQPKSKSKSKVASMAMDVDSSSSKPSTKSTKTPTVTASFVSSAAMAAKAKSKRLEEEEEEEDSDEEPVQPKSKSKSKAASMAMDVDSTSASSKPLTKPTKTPTVTASFVSSAAMAAKAKSKRLEEEEEEEEDSDEEEERESNELPAPSKAKTNPSAKTRTSFITSAPGATSSLKNIDSKSKHAHLEESDNNNPSKAQSKPKGAHSKAAVQNDDTDDEDGSQREEEEEEEEDDNDDDDDELQSQGFTSTEENTCESEFDIPTTSEVSSRASLRSRKSTASMVSQENMTDMDDMGNAMEDIRPYIPSPSPPRDRPQTPPNRLKRPYPQESPVSPLDEKQMAGRLTARPPPGISKNAERESGRSTMSQNPYKAPRQLLSEYPHSEYTEHTDKNGGVYYTHPSNPFVRRHQYGGRPLSTFRSSSPAQHQAPMNEPSLNTVSHKPVAIPQRSFGPKSHSTTEEGDPGLNIGSSRRIDMSMMAKGKQPIRQQPALNHQPVASSSKPQRDPKVTLSQLQGHSRTTPAFASTSSSRAPTTSMPSSSGSSFPTHREPSLFERRPVSPPPVLPAKKANPFSAPYNQKSKKSGAKRR